MLKKFIIINLLFFSSIFGEHVSQLRSKAREQRTEEIKRKKLKKQETQKKIESSIKSGIKKEKAKKKKDLAPSPLVLIDKVDAELAFVSSENNEISTELVTMQDVNRQGFDGSHYNSDDLIDMKLADEAGNDLKITMSDDDINRYLQKSNMSQDYIKRLSETWWFPDLAAFYKVLKESYRGRMALNYQIDSQVVVSEEEIKKYYDEHPVWIETSYVIETAFEPLGDKKIEELQKDLQEEDEKNGLCKIRWDLPSTIKESEIGKNNVFILDMQIGDVYLKTQADGVVLFRLKNKSLKHLVSYKDRHLEISRIIKLTKAEAAEKKVKESLREGALIYKPALSAPAETTDLN